MQTDNIKRLALFEPFFNLEIDFKNDYVEYISTTNQNAVTPHTNIIKKIQKFTFIYFDLSKSQSQNNALSLM